METLFYQKDVSRNLDTSNYRRPHFMREEIEKRFSDVLVLCIPAFKFVEIETIGRLFATDIIIMAIFPLMLLSRYKRLNNRFAIIIIIMGLLWLFNQIITDLIRDIPSIDYYRGWAKICVTLVHFTTLFLLIYDKKRCILLFALGLSIGNLLEYYLNPGIYAIDYPWKFGIGKSVTWIVVVAASLLFKRSFILSIILLGFAFILNLYMDFRSLSGICFISTIYLSLQWYWTNKNKNKINLSFRQLVTIGILLTFASYIFLEGYEHLAKQGFLGETAQKKYKWQSSGDFGVLLGGRSEILVSSRAIMNSPIIGYGSWAKDLNFAELMNYLMRDLGYIPETGSESELIPTHSYIFGAWVEAGICGALFWGFVMALIARVLTMMHNTRKDLSVLVTFFAFLLLWDIFFSPFGSDQRFIAPYYVIVILSFMNVKPKKFLRNRQNQP